MVQVVMSGMSGIDGDGNALGIDRSEGGGEKEEGERGETAETTDEEREPPTKGSKNLRTDSDVSNAVSRGDPATPAFLSTPTKPGRREPPIVQGAKHRGKHKRGAASPNSLDIEKHRIELVGASLG